MVSTEEITQAMVVNSAGPQVTRPKLGFSIDAIVGKHRAVAAVAGVGAMGAAADEESSGPSRTPSPTAPPSIAMDSPGSADSDPESREGARAPAALPRRPVPLPGPLDALVSVQADLRAPFPLAGFPAPQFLMRPGHPGASEAVPGHGPSPQPLYPWLLAARHSRFFAQRFAGK